MNLFYKIVYISFLTFIIIYDYQATEILLLINILIFCIDI